MTVPVHRYNMSKQSGNEQMAGPCIALWKAGGGAWAVLSRWCLAPIAHHVNQTQCEPSCHELNDIL